MDLKNLHPTFIFPGFDNSEMKCKASYENLQKFYQQELTQATKRAFKLNDKTYIQIIWRQSVSLAENIFHDSTIPVLNSSETYKSTSHFLSIIRDFKKPTLAEEINIRDGSVNNNSNNDYCQQITTIKKQNRMSVKENVLDPDPYEKSVGGVSKKICSPRGRTGKHGPWCRGSHRLHRVSPERLSIPRTRNS
jgi:hypothetical protein